MEFAHIGTRCSVASCKQHDFLPFTCDACKKVFCLEHRQYIDHSCPAFATKEVPICPICEQPVPWYPIDAKTVDEVVDYHLRSQKCPKLQQKIVQNNETLICQVPSCKHTASLKCKFCRQYLCLDHRNELDHTCSMEKTNGKSLGNTSTISSNSYTKQNSKLAQLHQQRQVRPNSSTSSTTTNVAPKPLTNVQKLKALESKFGNLKTKPIGQETIEREDRIFLDVYFPLDSNQQPYHMFFSKNWKIGKVLDKICLQGKIENKNTSEQDATKRLNLFHIQTFLKLPTDKTLQELLSANQIKNNDGIILERGSDVLNDEVKQAIENTKKNPEQAPTTCIIN